MPDIAATRCRSTRIVERERIDRSAVGPQFGLHSIAVVRVSGKVGESSHCLRGGSRCHDLKSVILTKRLKPKMSSKQHKEDKHMVAQVLPRCLVIVFKTKRDRKSDACVSKSTDVAGEVGGSGRPASPHHPGPDAGLDPTGPHSGKALFDSFLTENKDCYWNPHLEESVKNLKYIGLIHPNTLMVCGRDIYLDTVRNAWARRVLQAPGGYSIHRVGKLTRWRLFCSSARGILFPHTVTEGTPWQSWR